MFDKKNIPNYITMVRIVGAVILPFLPPFSTSFFVIYTVCGASDAVDGFAARRLRASSEAGAKLDSISDLLFYSAMMFHLIPFLLPKVSSKVWFYVGFVLAVRVVSYIVAAVRFRCFASIHTYANKFTGMCVFCMPYTLMFFGNPELVCMLIACIGGIASAEELLIHAVSVKYPADCRTIFKLKS